MIIFIYFGVRRENDTRSHIKMSVFHIIGLKRNIGLLIAIDEVDFVPKIKTLKRFYATR